MTGWDAETVEFGKDTFGAFSSHPISSYRKGRNDQASGESKVSNYRIVSHQTLGSPTVAGQFYVSGLGNVTLTERDIEEWKADGYQMRMKLIETSGIAEKTYSWQFIGWDAARP